MVTVLRHNSSHRRSENAARLLSSNKNNPTASLYTTVIYGIKIQFNIEIVVGILGVYYSWLVMLSRQDMCRGCCVSSTVGISGVIPVEYSPRICREVTYASDTCGKSCW